MTIIITNQIKGQENQKEGMQENREGLKKSIKENREGLKEYIQKSIKNQIKMNTDLFDLDENRKEIDVSENFERNSRYVYFSILSNFLSWYTMLLWEIERNDW
jgi:hypothetical protein